MVTEWQKIQVFGKKSTQDNMWTVIAVQRQFKKLCDEEFCNLHGSSSIVRAVKARLQGPWNTA
jgi:NADH:ubiquinone oxidoreductase subunit E